jgi:hypothetical protein
LNIRITSQFEVFAFKKEQGNIHKDYTPFNTIHKDVQLQVLSIGFSAPSKPSPV